MSLLDSSGNPVQPQLDQTQVMQLMTGLRIRIDAANAQLVQLGLLVEYLYENLEKQDISIPMDGFPEWAEARYNEIQQQAQQAMEQSKEEINEIKRKIKDEVENSTTGLDFATDVEEALNTALANNEARDNNSTDTTTTVTDTTNIEENTEVNTDTEENN